MSAESIRRDPGPSMSARRHGAEVTADRLREALDRWPDAFDGHDRDAIGRIIHALEQIAANRNPA